MPDLALRLEQKFLIACAQASGALPESLNESDRRIYEELQRYLKDPELRDHIFCQAYVKKTSGSR